MQRQEACWRHYAIRDEQLAPRQTCVTTCIRSATATLESWSVRDGRLPLNVT